MLDADDEAALIRHLVDKLYKLGFLEGWYTGTAQTFTRIETWP